MIERYMEGSVRKKIVKERRTRDTIPPQFRAPIDPEEFKFCLLLGDAAGRQKMPMKSPAECTITIGDDDGSSQTYRFADLPMTRAMMAITQHFRELDLPEDQRFGRVMSLDFRIRAMMGVLEHPSFEPWVQRDGGETGIHDAVLEAAAITELPGSGKFNPRKFLKLVVEIANRAESDAHLVTEWS